MEPLRPSRERWLVGLLALAAATRVFLMASAFPFFNNIDEHRHADVVHKYARGFLPPAGEVPFDVYTASLIAAWGSPEFSRSPEELATGSTRRPLGSDPTPEARARIKALSENYSSWVSIQAHSPPVYYFLAGRVFASATTLGLSGIEALYCVRWMNVVMAALLVVLSWLLLRTPYADEALIRLGVPILVATYPNDLWYGLSDDVPLPLFGGVAFLCLVNLAIGQGWWRFAATGFVLALAFLSKYSAVGLLGVAGVVTALGLRDRASRIPAGLVRWAALWIAAGLPIGLWLLRNRLVVGTWGAQQFKAVRMTMTERPVSEWIDHPLATPAGWLQFLPRLTSDFWTGQFLWLGHVMTWPWLDTFYIASTAILLVLCAASLAAHANPESKRRIEALALLAIAAAVATLAQLSLSWNLVTGNFHQPWSEFPYFASGRYISWALVPLAIAMLRGMSFLCVPLPAPLRAAGPWLLLTAFVAVVVGTETILSRPVFDSPYNWFHLG